jgi:hypothetical protein
MKLKAFLTVAFVALLTLWAGCATSRPYTGDEVNPVVTDVRYTHWNTVADPRRPYWVTNHVLTFKNPKLTSVTFAVDCENNYYSVDVPARTAQDLLIVPSDGACKITRTR